MKNTIFKRLICCLVVCAMLVSSSACLEKVKAGNDYPELVYDLMDDFSDLDDITENVDSFFSQNGTGDMENNYFEFSVEKSGILLITDYIR